MEGGGESITRVEGEGGRGNVRKGSERF